MSLLIISGLLYLIGISTVLILKPQLMFSKDGNWKEFGIGRNKDKYTWMPFWLFAITWAIISYIIVLVIANASGFLKNKTELVIQNELIDPENVSTKSMMPVPLNLKKKPSSNDMKSGYYILDTNETMKKGIPKYIYLGPEAPNVIYNSIDSQQMDE